MERGGYNRQGRSLINWRIPVLSVIAMTLLLIYRHIPDPFAAIPQLSYQFDANQGRTIDKSVSGVTGVTFTGDSIRRYNGPRYFSERIPHPQFLETSVAYAQIRPTANFSHTRWAVCTTVHSPTEALLDFFDSKDWAIVIVGDEGMEDFRVNGTNAVFLDVAAQEALKRQFPGLLGLLPWRHFGRKNIGYLYSILHGAELIWDFDDDNYLREHFPHLVLEEDWPVTTCTASPAPNTGDLTDIHCPAFNPLPLMGGDTTPYPMWPRGYPLSLIRKECQITLTPGGDLSRVAIFQSLADHEPDVDGIYRLTRQTPMTFALPRESKSQFVVVAPGLMSPFNAQATLVKAVGFWSLLLPISVHGRVSDIWRAYISQRLLWDAGLQIAFTTPLVEQFRNPHDPLADMKAEEDLYFKSLAMVQFLSTWQGRASDLPGRFEELTIELYERDYLGKKDVQLVQEWLRALGQIGYAFPSVTRSVHSDIGSSRSPTGNVVSDSTRSTHLASLDSSMPQWSPRTIWTSDLHDGTRCDIASMFAGMNHTVILAGSKGKTTPYPEVFEGPHIAFPARPLSPELQEKHLAHSDRWSEEEVRALFGYYQNDPQLAEVDAFICMFPASQCEAWMPFNKSIIVWAAHRYSLGRCSLSEWERLNTHLNDMLAIEGGGHVLAGVTRYDVEYINYFTGLRPKLIPSTALWYTDGVPGSLYSGTAPQHPEILVGPLQRTSFTHLEQLQAASQARWSFDFAKSIYGRYEMRDLLNHRAMVLFPYATTSYGFIEVYALGIPMFVPTPEFLYELGVMVDRRMRDPWYCGPSVQVPDRHPNATHPFSPEADDRQSFLYWVRFSDFYEWPYITQFSSWDDLLDKLDTADFDSIRQAMMQENAQRKQRIAQEWETILNEIPTGQKLPSSYDAAVQEIWRTSMFMK